MRPIACSLGLLAGLLLFDSPSSAGGGGNPWAVPFQALLKTSAGAPVNGNVSVTFRLYTAPFGGAALWTEARTCTASDGIIALSLGQLTPLPQPLPVPAYVGIQVGSDVEMTPRVLLSAAPYAFRLPNVSVDADGNVGIGLENPFGALDVALGVRSSVTSSEVDQSFMGGASLLASLPGYSVSQSFRASVSGLLTRIEFRMALEEPGSFNTAVSLYAVDGPSVTLLETASIDEFWAGEMGLRAWPVSFASASLTAGRNYLVKFYTNKAAKYGFGETTGGVAYPYGCLTAGSVTKTNWDLDFATYMKPVGGLATEHPLVVTTSPWQNQGARVGIRTLKPDAPLSIRQNPPGSWLTLKTEDDQTAWGLRGSAASLGIAADLFPLFTLTNTGKLGIGLSPVYPLDIRAPQSVIRLASSSETNGSVLELRNDSGSGDLTLGAINFVTYSGGYPGQIAYNKAALGDSLVFRVGGDERLRIVSGGRVGIGLTAPVYPLDVQGDINARGSVRANGVALTSDGRLKQDIQTIPNGLQSVLALRGVTYKWNRDAYPGRGLPPGPQMGFIAQDVEQVLPEVVETGLDGIKAVHYQNILPVLVEAIKTQQKQIDALTAEVQRLKAKGR